MPLRLRAEAGRLDQVLAAHLGSRSAAQRAIDAGRVRVDGQPKAKSHVLHGGEALEVDDAAPAAVEDAVPDAAFATVWEDEHLLVVDKPAGVVVHPGAGLPAGTLVQALGDRVAGGDDPERPGVVHRLDRDTSGLLVLAKDDATHAALQQGIRDRSVTREYLALVEGRVPSRTGTIDAPLGRDPRRRTRRAVDGDGARPAVTHFAVVEDPEAVLGGPLPPRTTLLRVTLETGRTHQIRAHLQAIGHPVAGDPEYGTAGRLGLPRQWLHAHRLAFAHPVTGEALDLRSPLPPDLAV